MTARLLLRSATVLLAALALARAQDAAPAAPPAAPTAPAEQPTITLEDCIAQALANNFDIKLQSLTTANARESLTIARADYDPSLNVTTRHNLSQSVNASTTLEGAAGPRSEGASANVNVNQRVITGASVTVASNLFNTSRTNNSFATFNPQYSSDLSLSVSQPLLRGFGSAYNQANILRNRIGLDRASLDYKGRVLDVIRDVENSYSNLVSAREQLEVRRFSLVLAQNLHEENKIRKSTGIATDLDVLTAEVGVANARNSVLLAAQSVRDREDALRNLLSAPKFDAPLIPASLSDPPETAPAIDHSYQLALRNQTDYQSTLASLKQLELDVLTAKSNRQPTLNFDSVLGYSGRDRDFGAAWDKVGERDSYNWQLGLTLRFPWGLHAENARYRTTLNNLSGTKVRLAQLEQNLLVQVRSAVRSVETNIESVRLSALSAELSRKKYDLEKARYDAGLSTARRVLEAQSDLESARLSLLQAKVTLRNALNALARLEGTSLERYQVTLP